MGSSGRISIEEFLQGWDTLNMEGGKTRAQAMFLQADFDKSGDITFNEFLASTFDWSTLESHHMEVSLRSFFRDLDCNDDGGVDVKELSAFFKGVLKPPEINEIFCRIDLDRDGVITKEEMQHFLFEPTTDEEMKQFPMPRAQSMVLQNDGCCAAFLNKKKQTRKTTEDQLLNERIAQRQTGRIRSDQ